MNYKFCIVVLLLGALTTSAPARAVAATDEDPRALLVEARAKVGKGQTAEAIALYRRAITLLPTDPGVRRELARLLSSRDETRNEAEKIYAEAVARAPHDAGLALEHAAHLVATGDGVNAVLEYRRAFEITPDNETAIHGYIQQVSRLGAAPVAIRQVSQKLVTTPTDLTARLILAELLRSEANYNDALNQYWLVQRAAPDNEVALRGAAEAWLALSYFERASELFSKIVSRDGKDRTLADQARVFIAAGRPEAAIRLLTVQLRDVEHDPSALSALADGYRALGQRARERVTLEKLSALDSTENALTLQRLARVYFEMGDREASRRACLQLLRLDPKNAIGTVGLSLLGTPPPQPPAEAKGVTSTRRAGLDRETAEAALFWKQPALALPNLRRALTVWPDSSRLQLALGSALLETNDTNGAVEAFASVAAKEANRLDALFGLAQAEMLRHNPERALVIYQKILSDNPANFRALSEKAEALRRLGDDMRAAALLTELARRAPDSSAINARLRDTLLALGRSFRSSPSLSLAQNSSSSASARSVGADGRFPAPIEPVLRAGDAVRVRVAGRPELSAETNLDENGMLKLPFLSQAIMARCLTERELREKIIKQGGPQFTGATITVTEYRRSPLIVAGAVHRPGSFHVRDGLNLLEGLMLASGATERAGRSIYVVRNANACEDQNPRSPATAPVEIYERTAVEERRVSPAQSLRTGDIVIVPDKDAIFLTGAIARASMISASTRLTLLKAVQLLGGTLAGAHRDHIRLLRLLPGSISRQEFIVDLNEIEKQRAGDVVLQPGDLVIVPSAKGDEEEQSLAALLKRIALGNQQLTNNPPPAALTSLPGEKR